MSLRQAYVDCIGQSSAEAPLREINVAARGSNILTEDDQLSLLRAHVEIVPCDISGDRHERPVVCVLEGLGISGLRLDLPPELA